jgi:hypothetical protein
MLVSESFTKINSSTSTGETYETTLWNDAGSRENAMMNVIR